MLISEAKKICPDLVLVDGEDLTPFRDVSKILFNFLRSHSWNGKAERLGFDEVFLGTSKINPTAKLTLTNKPYRCDGYHRLQHVVS